MNEKLTNVCIECYSTNSKATPLLNPLQCLQHHMQYVCGTCGRCICIGQDPKRLLYRWNFPFKSKDIALLYLRTAEFTTKSTCGIYEIKDTNLRSTYKIFPTSANLTMFLTKNKNKTCDIMQPVYISEDYVEYSNTQIKRLSTNEINEYLLDKQQ